MINYLDNLPRGSKRAILIGTDLLMLPFVLWVALSLRLSEWFPDIANIYWVFLLAPVIAIPVFMRLGLYRAVVRYMGGRAIISVLQGVTLAAILTYAAVLLVNEPNVLPRSVYGIYWAIALIYIGGSRLIIRTLFNSRSKHHGNRKVVVIYGAGASGAQLATGLLAAKECKPVAFIDDKKGLQGSTIQDLRVYSRRELGNVIEKYGATHVLLAMPSASRARRQEILTELEPYPVHVKTIPGLADLVSGKAQVDEIRDVDIEDLLGRDPIPPNESLLAKCIRHKSVLVTGSGGSIGSELCRQILVQQPRRLVLYEVSEFALYQIEQELINLAKLKGNGLEKVEICSILGSVTDKNRLRNVVLNFEVQTIYHAAAYKHVPLVEKNPVEGVRNNVFGTLKAAEVARDLNVENFVLISTDKAVRPTSVMGASKRLSELIIQAMARLQSHTRFCMVRFGNVLGSSGSVVPLFRRQIREGGPITVTHPEISRYFMTIPEAAQLVLQAGAMGQGGDVFVLDMAEPVRIVELATKMIHLSGLEVRDDNHPHGDIAIHFTGLRPGEKLYEELLIESKTSKTDHPRITRAEECELPWPELAKKLNELNQACHEFDCQRVRGVLRSSVSGYTPHAGAITDPAFNKLEQDAQNRERSKTGDAITGDNELLV